MKKILVLFLFCLCLICPEAQEGQPLSAERPSIALILGGGGARGFAHAAVLEIIEEMGIPVDFIAGISSGAIIGGLYSIGYSPAMIMEALESNDWASFFQDRPASPFLNNGDGLPFSLRVGASGIAPHWGLGYSSGQKVYGFIKSLTAKIPSNISFDDLAIPFRAGAMEIPGGRFELLGRGDLAEAIRASMSIQGVFEPFVIEGRSYIDGGFTNNLPVREVRELGYDIVIAVDLFSPPVNYSVELLDLPDLMDNLYSSRMGMDQHKLSDAVIFPLPAGISSGSFSKGREIYEAAKTEKEKIMRLLEPIRERVGGGKPPAIAAYGDLREIKPQSLIVKGALEEDRPLIEKEFSRRIKGRALNGDNLSAFLDRVYGTGNYIAALARAVSMPPEAEESCLELVLRPLKESKFLVRGGFDYEGSFSSDSYHRAALRGGVEFRGKKNSSILLKASVLDEMSIGLSLSKPLGPRSFLGAETALKRDQALSIDGILDSGSAATERSFSFEGKMGAGLLVGRCNAFALWPEYSWRKGEGSLLGAGVSYTFSKLNHSLFPTRGFRGRLENRLLYVPGGDAPFDNLGIDLAAAIPLGRRFSIGLSGQGASFFGETPGEIAAFGGLNDNRIFFPRGRALAGGISQAGACFRNEAAISLALQFEPLESLTLLGGRMLFLLAASAGGAFDWKQEGDFWNDRLIWNASAGAALLPGKAFGILLRAGAGGGAGNRAAPFLSVDIGMSGFGKNLF